MLYFRMLFGRENPGVATLDETGEPDVNSNDGRDGALRSNGLLKVTVIAAATLLVGGCASLTGGDEGDGQPDGDDESGEVVEMEADPVLVRADEDGEAEYRDAQEIFEGAYYDYQARRYDEAAEQYQLIIDHFPESRFFLPALYNGGLSYEELDRWEQAAETFKLLIEEFPESDEALNAEFRIARAYHELGKYEEVAERLTQLLLKDDLEHLDRVEAHVRRGKALLELEEWVDAENSFESAIERNREANPAQQLDEEHRYMVLAHFGRGRANHGRMSEIELVLPTERMEEDLEQKADYHQTAQGAYIRALQQHHPHWSVAAGYKIGRLYQDMYMDIFTAEIPDDLTDEELAFYFEELRDKLEVLMERAMNVYERNLSFSRRVAPRGTEAEEWVEATSVHLERMRAFLEDPVVQQRAEQLVMARGELEELWDPFYYAGHHVEEAVEQAREALPQPDVDEEPGEVALDDRR